MESLTSHDIHNDEPPTSETPTACPTTPYFHEISPILHEFVHNGSPSFVSTKSNGGRKTKSDSEFLPTSADASSTSVIPTAIILFGWASAPAQSLTRFAKGHVALFPKSRVFIVPCTATTLFFQTDQQAKQAMMPLVWELSGQILDVEHSQKENSSLTRGGVAKPARVILHAMSNGGLVSLRALCHAWLETFLQPLPHTLFILDSCPGSGSWKSELIRWGYAAGTPLIQGNHTANKIPGLRLLLGVAGMAWVTAATGIPEVITGHDNLIQLCRDSANDPRLLDTRAARVYIYGPADDAIRWQDIESSMEDAQKSQNWEGGVFGIKLEGSNHVVHERVHREFYWNSVQKAWDKAVKSGNLVLRSKL
ncbi:hypothetical protein F5884DRAFT_891222 [Xylogone sp. PMI_703]|nr:hypothetical protein F5884DRAFT_891222 [Xylogone sp. PMI_703]